MGVYRWVAEQNLSLLTQERKEVQGELVGIF